MNSISYNFRVAEQTVSQIIRETCGVIWNRLSPVYVPYPTPAHLRVIAADFERLWNMPNCVGAIDGKHIVVQVRHENCPSNVLISEFCQLTALRFRQRYKIYNMQ